MLTMPGSLMGQKNQAAAASAPSLLLDTYTAAAAHSLRKLRTAYAGSACRIRESGGDTETDIGFDGSGNFDSAAAEAHCGANDGFIVTMYDQSGNGWDVTQSTAGDQLKIVSSGSVVTIGSMAAVQGVGGTTSLINTAFTDTDFGPGYYCAVIMQSTQTSSLVLMSGRTGGTIGYCYIATQGGVSTTINSNSGASISYRKNGSVLSPQPTDRGDLYDQYHTGSAVLVGLDEIDPSSTGWGDLTLFGYGGSGIQPDANTKFGERIIFDNPDDVAAIEAQLKTDWSIA